MASVEEHLGGRWADPLSVLGMLQRGRGEGWLRAAGDPARGRRLLVQMLACDPRWDRQVESRSDYYATLAMTLAISGIELAQAARPADAAAENLLESVVAMIARRGDLTGLEWLKDRLADPKRARDILWRLINLAIPEALEEVPERILAGLSDDDLVDLAHEFGRSGPWTAWALVHPRLAAVAEIGTQHNGRSNTLPPSDASVVDLLAYDWSGSIPKRVMHRLAGKLTPKELQVVHAAAAGAVEPPRSLALAVLGRRRDPGAVDSAVNLLSGNGSGRSRAAAIRYLEALPAPVTLPLARQWIDADDGRQRVAATLLGLHAEPNDLPVVVTALERSWDRRDIYTLCSLMDALSRHPDHQPPAVLRQIFEQVEYSYARIIAAGVLASSDPTFPATYGYECLWDCESRTRCIGLQVTQIDHDEARTRIEVLALDPHQDDEVRARAHECLEEP